MRVNLLEKATEVLHKNDRRWEDVRSLQDLDGEYALFGLDAIQHVLDVCHESGYGTQEIANDLVIVGDGWWMDRRCYDGAEWWAFNEQPKIARADAKVIRYVRGDNESVKEVHSE